MIQPPAKPAATKNRIHPKPNPKLNPNLKTRNPLKDLNTTIPSKIRNTTCRSTSSTTSTNCLRVHASNSSSSSSSISYTTPRNHQQQQQQQKLPDTDSRNPRNVTSNKIRLKSSKTLDTGRKIRDGSTDPKTGRRAGNKFSSRICQKEKKQVVSDGKDQLLGIKSKSGGLKRGRRSKGKNDEDFEFTPVGCKAVGSDCGKNGDGSGNTPPAEVTVSPEMQCGSNVMSAATHVCFGAGHVLSGVSDKRKCRPRGVLVVGDNCKGIDGLGISNDDLVGSGDNDGGGDLVPLLPVEASMHWLLSPSDEGVELNGESEVLTSVHLQSPVSSSSNIANNDKCSRDTLGSENVIKTPESYTSLERHMSLPWFHADDKKNAMESNLDFAVDGQEQTSFSSEDYILASDQIDSSFEFSCHLKPASSIEFSQLQFNWDKSSWISDANVEHERRSQLRISWRDGLSSCLTEMVDSNCYRCISDDETKTDRHSLDPGSPEPKLPDISSSSFKKIFNVKSTGGLKGYDNSTVQKDIPCAESISLDRGSLAASGDSDWDMCYKNILFHVE